MFTLLLGSAVPKSLHGTVCVYYLRNIPTRMRPWELTTVHSPSSYSDSTSGIIGDTIMDDERRVFSDEIGVGARRCLTIKGREGAF